MATDTFQAIANKLADPLNSHGLGAASMSHVHFSDLPHTALISTDFTRSLGAKSRHDFNAVVATSFTQKNKINAPPCGAFTTDDGLRPIFQILGRDSLER